MRIAILGATGHIGSWLVPRLVRERHDVVAVSRGVRKPYHEAPEWSSVAHVTMDRTMAENDGSYGSRIAALEPDVVIDLICFEVSSARRLVEALRGRVELFLHCGTLWVHGATRSCPYNESAPREPFGEYGIRKAAIERYLLEEATHGFPAAVFHPGHISGPGWTPINPAGNLDIRVFEKLARGETVTLPDDGAARLQHVHANDVAQAFALAVAHPAEAIGNAFHVAAHEPVTMRDYAMQAANWFGRGANIEYVPLNDWVTSVSDENATITRDHVMHSPCASIEKACSRLGFHPEYSAVAAAEDAVSWLVEKGRITVS
ncbi:MAG: NAD-dependent epimerase/dehydratase family protein [Longimicrobiales bacterium]